MHKLPVEIQSLIDAQENPFVLIDADYRVVAANQAYCTAYGISEAQVVGRTCHEVSHHSPVPCHLKGENCPHQKVFETGQPHHVLHTHYDQFGRPDHVRIKGHPVRGQNGQLYLGEAIFPFTRSAESVCEEMRMIGKSAAFLECVDKLSRVAESEAPILLHGESGVGKELAAQYIHERSDRKGKAFVAVDCASVAESVFESELFGHERGAFTGCIGRKLGLIELANGGTLFLDEIGEIPLAMQAKLLRALESGEFRRVGGTETLKADVRIVSATNRDLLAMSDRGQFRLDLYYRIAGIDVQLPPLRERRMDIPLLAEAMLARISHSRETVYHLTDEARERLAAYHYPGNIRELRNILLKASALSNNGVIGKQHIIFNGHQPRKSTPAAAPATSAMQDNGEAPPSITELEAKYIAELLAHHNGHRRTVAETLGISERTLYRKLNRYQLRQKRTNFA